MSYKCIENLQIDCDRSCYHQISHCSLIIIILVRYFIVIQNNYFIIGTIVCTCLFFQLPCPEELIDFELEYYLFQSNCDIYNLSVLFLTL